MLKATLEEERAKFQLLHDQALEVAKTQAREDMQQELAKLTEEQAVTLQAQQEQAVKVWIMHVARGRCCMVD